MRQRPWKSESQVHRPVRVHVLPSPIYPHHRLRRKTCCRLRDWWHLDKYEDRLSNHLKSFFQKDHPHRPTPRRRRDSQRDSESPLRLFLYRCCCFSGIAQAHPRQNHHPILTQGNRQRCFRRLHRRADQVSIRYSIPEAYERLQDETLRREILRLTTTARFFLAHHCHNYFPPGD